MLCKNCGYVLSGKENFCPGCACPVKAEAEKKARDEKAPTHSEEQIIKQEYIFPESEIEERGSKRQLQIFADSDQEDEKEKAKPKGHGGRIMLLLFLICAFAAGSFAVMDYFDLTATVSGLAKASVEDEAQSVYDHKSSIVKPDKSLELSEALVMSGEGIMLRKGPGKAYAPLISLKEQSTVQILGQSLASEGWVYVYCPENEAYGWLDAAFITDSTSKNTVTAEAATVQESYIQ